METIGERLRAALFARNMKASELARIMRVSSASVTNWTNGTAKQIRAENIFKICKVLKVNDNWLLHGKGPMDREVVKPININELSTDLHICISLLSQLPESHLQEMATIMRKRIEENERLYAELTKIKNLGE